MKFLLDHKLNIRKHRFLFSVLLGAACGLSVYGYWLSDFLPSDSLRLLFFAFIAGFAGFLCYYILLEFWIVPRFTGFPAQERFKIVLAGIIIGSSLMFGGTSAWVKPDRYLTFLLPRHELEITVLPTGNQNISDVSILWLSTSLGDISYQDLELEGWAIRENELVLIHPNKNLIRWQGKTGDDAFILFRKSPQGEKVSITWDGVAESYDLYSQKAVTMKSTRKFITPIYASNIAIAFLTLMNFWVIGLALSLVFWIKKADFHKAIEYSVVLRANISVAKKDRIQFVVVASMIILLAIGLRIFHLGDLFPAIDEYNHLIAAKEIMQGAKLADVYQRSLFIITLPVVASYKIFGESLWVARLPGVVFNVLGIIPLFLIARRINDPVAIISSFLYATSPYLIAFSRNVREYSFYPLYFYSVAYVMIVFLKNLPSRFISIKDMSKLGWNHLLLFLLLCLPIPHSLGLNKYSTFRLVLIEFGVLAAFIFFRFDLKNWRFWLLGSIIAMGIIVALPYRVKKLMGPPLPDFQSLTYFFLNPPQQWYYDRLVVLPVLALIIGLYVSYRVRRWNLVPLFLCGMYAGYLFFFIFHFSGTGFNMHPRFVLAAHVWFIPIFAMGIYSLWVFMRFVLELRKNVLIVVVSLLMVSTFNINQILLSTFFKGEWMPITLLLHNNLDIVNTFMLENADANDTLVGSIYAEYVHWKGKPYFFEAYNYSNTELAKEHLDGHSYILSIVEGHVSGWIVIDDLFYGIIPPGLPQTETSIHGKTITYMGKFGSQHVWRWSVK